MSPDELKKARSTLKCSAKEISAALGIDFVLWQAWELGDQFPTKKNIQQIESLLTAGPGSIVRKSKRSDPFESLRDPDVWALLRKLIAHPKLRAEVAKIAERYEEP